ncbi:MAG: hypothetical protein LBL32_00015 [Holosporales bacterium]|jgi:hypothetical protein|nr:hypothetical protein [Holosporales bacterium]
MIKIKQSIVSITFLVFGIGSAAADDPPAFNPNEVEMVIWLEHKLDGSGGGAIMDWKKTGRASGVTSMGDPNWYPEFKETQFTFNGDEFLGSNITSKIRERPIWETNEPALVICNDGDRRYVWLCSWPTQWEHTPTSDPVYPDYHNHQWQWQIYGPTTKYTVISYHQITAYEDEFFCWTFWVAKEPEQPYGLEVTTPPLPESGDGSLLTVFSVGLTTEGQIICITKAPTYIFPSREEAISESSLTPIPTPPPSPSPTPTPPAPQPHPVHKPVLKDLLRLGVHVGDFGFGIGLGLHDVPGMNDRRLLPCPWRSSLCFFLWVSPKQTERIICSGKGHHHRAHL